MRIEMNTAQRNLLNVGLELTRVSNRLSSGYRINSAADDAAGLAISMSMRAQIFGLDRANRNAQDASSLIMTAEGGIAGIGEKVQRIRELVVMAANDTYVHNYNVSQRAMIQAEINQLIMEIDQITERVEFNSMRLLSRNVTTPPRTPVMATAAQSIQPHLLRPTAPTVINSANIASGGAGWTYYSGVLTITAGGDFRVDGAGLSVNHIVVEGSAETNLILNNVNVVATENGAALDVRNANVNLWLDGNNTLDASNTVVFAGVQTTGGSLTINGTGRLDAIGGFQGAGIGGGASGVGLHGYNGGNLTINSGVVNAVARTGAAIGGGGGAITGGSGGNITINGGMVFATTYYEAMFGGNIGAAIGGGGFNGGGANFVINGGLVELADGQWIGGGMFNENSGTTNVMGGNLSINPGNIRNNATHDGAGAFRLRISLEDENGNSVNFGAFTAVTYTINGLTVSAITDSRGYLFMYLPTTFDGQEGEMNFGGRTFREHLAMLGNHDNHLILTIYEPEIVDPPNGPPARQSRREIKFHFQIGANSGQSMFLRIGSMDAEVLGLRSGGTININVAHTSGEYISRLISSLDSALRYINKERAKLGAAQNRLEFTMRSLAISSENLSGSKSGIMDADMAAEKTRFVKGTLLKQAGLSVFDKKKQMQERVVHLLRR